MHLGLRNEEDSDTLRGVGMTQTRLTFILRLGSTLVLWALMLSTVFAGYEFGFLALLGIMALRADWQ